MEKLSFELALKEIPVEMKESDGRVKIYKLKEMDGTERDKFLDDFNQRLKYSGTEIQGLHKYEGLQAGLLSRCLYNDKNELVTEDELQKFPASVLNSLFQAANDLSKLTLTNEDMAKVKNG